MAEPWTNYFIWIFDVFRTVGPEQLTLELDKYE